MYSYIHIYINTYIYIDTYIYMCVCVLACMCVCVCVYHHERIAIRNNLSPQRPPTAGIVAVDNARHIGVFTVAVVEGRRKVRLVSHRDILKISSSHQNGFD